MFSITVPFLSLEQIDKSWQSIRWIRLRDDTYIIPYNNMAARVKQRKDELIISCDDEQFYDVWFNYFDLQTDYSAINYAIKLIDNDMNVWANRARGVRVLKQDLFETIVAYVITDGDVYKTRVKLKTIATQCGYKHQTTIKDAGVFSWYEFPGWFKILEDQDKLIKCNLGNAFDKLIDVCNDINDRVFDLDYLRKLSYYQAKAYLISLGIPQTRADCICLYGLHHLEAFPLTSNVINVIEDELDCTTDDFIDWYATSNIVPYMGVLNQYMGWHNLNPPKEYNAHG